MAWNALKVGVMAVWASITEDLGPALLQLWDSLQRLWAAINPAFVTALKILAGILAGILVVATWAFLATLNIFIKILGGVASGISNVIKWISNFISWIGNAASWTGRMAMSIANAFVNLKNRISSTLQSLPGTIKSVFSRAVQGALNIVWGFYGRFVDAGWGLIRAFGNGIKSAAQEVYNAVKSVGEKARNLLPFSDAKEGPLSDLTLSGRRFSETFAKGITSSAGAIRGAVEGALSLPAQALQGSMSVSSRYAGMSPPITSPVPAGSSSNINYYGPVNIYDKSDAGQIMGILNRGSEIALDGGGIRK